MILEQLLEAIRANTAALQAHAAALGQPMTTGVGVGVGVGVSTDNTNTAGLGLVGPGVLGGVAPFPQVTDQGQPITADAITALIQPHIGNEAIKGELGAAMRGMGINALPETQPHQFAELYHKFKGVIAKYAGAGQAQTASII